MCPWIDGPRIRSGGYSDLSAKMHFLTTARRSGGSVAGSRCGDERGGIVLRSSPRDIERRRVASCAKYLCGLLHPIFWVGPAHGRQGLSALPSMSGSHRSPVCKAFDLDGSIGLSHQQCGGPILMPECNECGESYPASQGRWIEWEHLTGRTHARSSGTRTGSGHSSSFSRGGGYRFGNSNSRTQSTRSSTRDHTRVDRIFVCNDCKAPKNYGHLRNTLIAWAIVAFIVYAAGQWAWEKFNAWDSLHGGSFATTASSKPAAQDSNAATPAIPEPARGPILVKPKVVFAAPKEVVQDIAPERDKLIVKCSTTVTDHCSE